MDREEKETGSKDSLMGMPGIIDNYVGKKLGNFLTDLVSDMNPVKLHHAGQANGATDPDIVRNVSAIKELVTRDTKTTRSGASHYGEEQRMSLSQYFAGKKMKVTPGEEGQPNVLGGFIDERGNKSRATTRSIAAGSVAAFGIAPMALGEDNFVSRAIGAGASFGAHAGITAAAVRSGGAAKMFGVGYGGLAAVNAIRSGNNFGPF
jgi:hypothetical protein